MKVAFFGTPQFAAVTLERLLESSHEVVCVVTQPDKPAGRGRKLQPPPVKQIAEAAGIPVHQPASIKRTPLTDVLVASGAQVAVVVAYGQILPVRLLDALPFGFLNIHGSLLPKYRGAAPIQWAIANGETTTGVTIMQIDEGLDSGPVLARAEAEILEDDDARSIHDLLSLLGANTMLEVLDRIEAEGRVESTPQDHEQATLAPLIKRDDARIDWEWPPEKIICRVRGFLLWPGAFSEQDGTEIKLLAAEAVAPSWMTMNWKAREIVPGTIVDVLKGRGFIVKTGGDGLVLITRIKIAGKKEMDADSAINGGLIKIGMQLK
ncbi:MAG: methionyl-tRNA formyltransferase [Candidatus Sumerlaeota bacterium]|nr:methionyl-tRNA formyltransferase [Candidatus Sumerlaeota bacterium]